MMPYTERFDDFEILTLRFTILRNCPHMIITVYFSSMPKFMMIGIVCKWDPLPLMCKFYVSICDIYICTCTLSL